MSEIVAMLLAGQNDLAWFESHLESLRNKYNNRFIAFRDEKVLHADEDVNRLMDRLKREGIDMSSVLVRFVSKVKSIL